MNKAHILGFPRIGAQRELKFAQEAFWRKEIDAEQLSQVGSDLRQQHWHWQGEAGLDYVTVGDFAWYDQVLNTLALFGALPTRFGFDSSDLSLNDYFSAARGSQQQVAMSMTKWFDTNYHYLVPEWTPDIAFNGGCDWLFDEVAQAQKLGHNCKVVLLGPLSLLYLGKPKAGLSHALDLLHKLIPAYQRVLQRLKSMGIEWVQIDEPILTLDLQQEWLRAFQPCYDALAPHAPQILFATYFGAVDEHAALLHRLPIAGVHFDLVRAPDQLTPLLKDWPNARVLSAGIIDGRNIWRSDLSALREKWQPFFLELNSRNIPIWLAPSCSLLHVPVDLGAETALDTELFSWLAFARQKLTELQTLKHAFDGKHDAVQTEFVAADTALNARKNSKRIHIASVQKRVANLTSAALSDRSPFATRRTQQKKLPLFPTTTIGSFPQTSVIRQARAAYKKGALKHLDYLEAMRSEIRHCIAQQEEIGLDVLVHGEAERNDMVEYFGEQLSGFAFTQYGWVQSYGSRCVKPPLIFGDVARPEAMTVEWSSYAQSLSKKPVKGMLTGPITLLQWSFVRDDLARHICMQQLALALRDEVIDLERAGISIIQIDEPAFREGLPLKQKEWRQYLDAAVLAFKICSSGVRDETQIHTHMCYSEFNDILPWIAAMDADVITIETSRSDMCLLEGFSSKIEQGFSYPNDIGPGVYDIHSPRIASITEMLGLLQKARAVIADERLWVNPDCGLKTRDWPETRQALKNMVAAAHILRAQVFEKEDCELSCEC